MGIKVHIRPLEENDALISWRWRNDPVVWEFTGNRPDIEITPEIELNWIKLAISESNSKRFAIIADGVYVGNIQLTSILPNNTAEYHVFIGDKLYWGKGVAYVASLAILEYAKEELKLKSIYLYVKQQNKNAIKLYEKCGFRAVSEDIKMVVYL